MAIISPFRAVRPKLNLASQVAAPPYDVVSLEEARNLSKGNPNSFLRVSRAELELDPNLEPYSDTVYEHGAKNLRNLISAKSLIQEDQPMPASVMSTGGYGDLHFECGCGNRHIVNSHQLKDIA